MKNITLCMVFVLCSILGGCDDAKYNTLSTHAYFKEAQRAMGTKVTIAPTGITSTLLTICVSDKAPDDCSFKLVSDQALLDKYNKINGTHYIMLPQQYYELPEKVTILKGGYMADEVILNIKPLSKEMIASGELYAIPLKLESLDGKLPTTDQTSTYVITTENVIKFSAPILNGKTTVKVDMSPGEMVLNEYTVEMRFQIANFYENQALFSSEDAFIRLEDPIGTYNLIQVNGKGTYLNAITPYEKNKWQHMAIAFDGSKYFIYVNGKLDAQKEVSTGPVTFKTIAFAATSMFKADCLMSEIRVWDRVLNENNIKNNMIVVPAKSEGLRAYWKMNEGSGNVFEDATGNGYTATAVKDVKWIHDILSTDGATPWN